MFQNTVFLVDATSLCYRSFYAIKLTTSRGYPTGAVYGFFQTIKKLQSQYHPEFMGICFDVSRKTFRQEKFKDYKIQRPPMPDGLKTQVPLIKKLVHFWGMSLIEKEGFEADDIIASLAARAVQDNKNVVIVSSDKDMYQLLQNERVSIYNPVQEKLWTQNDFVQEYGFMPKAILDYLSLAGDSADNIPGAQGIGKTGAAKLIKQYATIENIFANLDEFTPKMKQTLLQSKENIFLSKELVQLCHCELDIGWDQLRIKEPDYEQVYKMFYDLEFKTLLKEIPAPSLNVKVEIKEGEQGALLEDIRKKKEVVLSLFGDDAFLLDVKSGIVHKCLACDIKDIVEDEEIKKISYDFKQEILSIKDSVIKGIWFDVQLAAYLIDPSLSDYHLSTIVSHYLGQLVVDIPPEAAPVFIYKLYVQLGARIKAEGLEKLFFDVEMPLISVLSAMQQYGVCIDLKAMDSLYHELDERLERISENIFKISGKKFNLNSPQQLREVLFTELKIPPLNKTKTGYSTGEDVLEKLALTYPIAEMLLEYRHLNKLKTTYVVPLIEQVKISDGVLHAQFNQAVTQTGRLSSSSPNLQSIPAKGEFSSHLRRAFISSFSIVSKTQKQEEGCLLSADYSQIELRILAHFSGEQALIDAFLKKRDIHRYTATLLFRLKEEDITDQQRDLAKKVNFAILYGMSSYGLSRELKISPQQAEIFIQDYFARYPRVNEYIQAVYKQCEEHGFVTTILGRKRYLPDFKNTNIQLREFAMRQAINTPIQGSCADLIKVAMVRIYDEIKAKQLAARLIMQIHDELVFDLPCREKHSVAEIIRRHMEQALPLSVPINVNLKIGSNWAEMEELI